MSLITAWIFSFSLEYFRKNPPPWVNSSCNLEPPPKKMKLSNLDNDTLESIFVYLQVFSSYFRHSWKWSQFLKQFLMMEDNYAKWLLSLPGIDCYNLL